MNEDQYLKRVLDLTRKLTDAANDDGVGSDAYNSVLKEIAINAVKFNRSRRVSSVVMSFVILSAILFVLYLVYCIVSEGFF